MGHITISDIEDHIVRDLKQMAWQKGLSLDEAVRGLLNETVLQRRKSEQMLGATVRAPFKLWPVPPETEYNDLVRAAS